MPRLGDEVARPVDEGRIVQLGEVRAVGAHLVAQVLGGLGVHAAVVVHADPVALGALRRHQAAAHLQRHQLGVALERAQIGVREAMHGAEGKASTVDDAGMVQLVGENVIVTSDERRDDADWAVVLHDDQVGVVAEGPIPQVAHLPARLRRNAARDLGRHPVIMTTLAGWP